MDMQSRLKALPRKERDAVIAKATRIALRVCERAGFSQGLRYAIDSRNGAKALSEHERINRDLRGWRDSCYTPRAVYASWAIFMALQTGRQSIPLDHAQAVVYSTAHACVNPYRMLRHLLPA